MDEQNEVIQPYVVYEYGNPPRTVERPIFYSGTSSVSIFQEKESDILLEFEPVDRYGNKYIIFNLEPGYVWAPYIPLQIIGGCDPTIPEDNITITKKILLKRS